LDSDEMNMLHCWMVIRINQLKRSLLVEGMSTVSYDKSNTFFQLLHYNDDSLITIIDIIVFAKV